MILFRDPVMSDVASALAQVEDAAQFAILTRGLRALRDLAADPRADHGPALSAEEDCEVLIWSLATWLGSGERLRDRPGLGGSLAALKQALDAELVGAPVASAAPRSALQARYDALAQKGAQRREQWLQARGGSLTSQEVAARLGLTRQAIHERARNNRLLSVKVGRDLRYPAWQFQEGGELVPGLEEVLECLKEHAPLTQIQFLLAPHPELSGRAPLDALGEGRGAEVCALARGFGHQGE
jgi:hypothetical protein